MLKGKEVISDPHKQYEIARQMHAQSHGGINKTTASIAEKYHWVRIKETVSAAIRNCTECKDSAQRTQTYTKERRIPKNNDNSGSSKGGRTSQAPPTDGGQQVVAGADPPLQHQRAPMANMQYSERDDMPVDPQLQQLQYIDGSQPMAIDSTSDAAASWSTSHEDVDARLREELESHSRSSYQHGVSERTR